MSGSRDEGGNNIPVAYETILKEEEAARLRASLACVLAALPPSPGSLPGCSPSFFGSSSPNRLPDASGMDGDTILLENETQV